MKGFWDRLWRRAPAEAAAHVPAVVGPVLAPLGGVDPDVRRRVLLTVAVEPALARLAALGISSDHRARVMLLAIAGQESDVLHRRQHNDGPARGLWQFERGGGVWGVMTHAATAAAAWQLVAERSLDSSAGGVWSALERDDVLAAAFARLLLWSDPAPLPAVDNPDAGWGYYLRTWRPGKPHPDRWAGHWRMARQAVKA